MKVSELIKALSSLDKDADVLCLQEFDVEHKIFEIDDVDMVQALKVKEENKQPGLKYGKYPGSKNHVVISITDDF